MLERLAAALTRWCTRWIPDAYVVAGLLIGIVLVVALIATPAGPADVVRAFGGAFWDFAPFTLQMAMVILSGYLVADAPITRRALAALAARATTPRGSVLLMALVSMGLGWIHWGLSIIASGLLARRLIARRLGADPRILVAAAYLGMGCVWHAGLSASAPLTSSDPSQPFVAKYLGGPVPATQTIFSPFNLILSVVVIAILAVLATLLQPKAGSPQPDTVPEDDPPAPALPAPSTPAEWVERTPWVNLLVAGVILGYLVLYVVDKGVRTIAIGHVNLLFLGVAALLHGSPASLLASAERGGQYVWGVILQFGLYAGVAGVLDKTGLAGKVADGFVAIATPKTYPLAVVWYSGILNYLVPSGGAKWFIEVAYLADAAKRLGVPLDRTILAYAWGDMLTDVIQPFWAIPLLALARLSFRDIMGACLVVFLVYATVVSAAFLALGLWF